MDAEEPGVGRCWIMPVVFHLRAYTTLSTAGAGSLKTIFPDSLAFLPMRGNGGKLQGQMGKAFLVMVCLAVTFPVLFLQQFQALYH